MKPFFKKNNLELVTLLAQNKMSPDINKKVISEIKTWFQKPAKYREDDIIKLLAELDETLVDKKFETSVQKYFKKSTQINPNLIQALIGKVSDQTIELALRILFLLKHLLLRIPYATYYKH